MQVHTWTPPVAKRLSAPVEADRDCSHTFGLGEIGGVLWTSSIIPLFAQKRPSDKLLAPTRCGNGHELTHDNLVLVECGTRWRCRQCGIERAAAWRRRHRTAA
jgi:hypothetical protein